MNLLIDDKDRGRGKLVHDFGGGEQGDVAVAGIELEATVVEGGFGGVLGVVADFGGGGAYAVAVYDDLDVGEELDVGFVGEHTVSKLVQDEDAVVADFLGDLVKVGLDGVDGVGVEGADVDQWHLAGLHGVFGVEGEVDVGVVEEVADAVDLLDDVAVAGLDVENNGRFSLLRHSHPLLNQRQIHVAMVVGWVLRGDGDDHVVGGQDGAAGHEGDEVGDGGQKLLVHLLAGQAAQNAETGAGGATVKGNEAVLAEVGLGLDGGEGGEGGGGCGVWGVGCGSVSRA